MGQTADGGGATCVLCFIIVPQDRQPAVLAWRPARASKEEEEEEEEKRFMELCSPLLAAVIVRASLCSALVIRKAGKFWKRQVKVQKATRLATNALCSVQLSTL